LDYKSQLKAYSKKQFDPFCRRERISFIDHDNNELVTTVGQLNFFEWIITDGILTYILEHREKIHQDMELRLETDTNRKRHELSSSASSLLSKHHVELKFSFE
jgi:hypothetical protein